MTVCSCAMASTGIAERTGIIEAGHKALGNHGDVTS
jgi:hypothetical protein